MTEKAKIGITKPAVNERQMKAAKLRRKTAQAYRAKLDKESGAEAKKADAET